MEILKLLGCPIKYIWVSDKNIGNIGISNENLGVSDEDIGVSDGSPMMMISSRTRKKLCVWMYFVAQAVMGDLISRKLLNIP